MKSSLLRQIKQCHPDRGGTDESLHEAVRKLQELRASAHEREKQRLRVRVSEEVATFGGNIQAQGICPNCLCQACKGKPIWKWVHIEHRGIRRQLVGCEACYGRGVADNCCSRIIPVVRCFDGQVVYEDEKMEVTATVERAFTFEESDKIGMDVRADWVDVLLERPLSVSLFGRQTTVSFSWDVRARQSSELEGVVLRAAVVEPTHDPRPILAEHLAR